MKANLIKITEYLFVNNKERGIFALHPASNNPGDIICGVDENTGALLSDSGAFLGLKIGLSELNEARKALGMKPISSEEVEEINRGIAELRNGRR